MTNEPDRPLRAVFNFRDFRLLLAAQLFIGFTQPMMFITQSWYISQSAPENFSAMFLGIAAAFRGLVFLSYIIIAGTLVDRFPRRTVMRANQGVTILLIILVSTVLYLFESAEPTLFRLFATILLFGAFGIVLAQDQPNKVALIRNSVNVQYSAIAISLFFAIMSFGALASGPVTGWLIEHHSYTLAYLFSGFGPAVGLVVALSIKTGRTAADTQSTGSSLSESIFQGIRVLKEHEILRLILALNWVSIALGSGVMGQLIAIWVDEMLGFSAFDWGIMIVSWNVGATLSTLALASKGHKFPRGLTLILAVAILGLSIFFYSWSRNLIFVFSFNLVCGASLMAINALSSSIVQSVVDNRVLGRINSFIFMSQGFMQIGALFLGFFATILGLQVVFSAVGLIILLTACFALIRRPLIRAFI
jgi:MFS family permease